MVKHLPVQSLLVTLVLGLMAGAGPKPKARRPTAPPKVQGKFMPPPGKMLVFVGGSWQDEFIKYREATGNNPSGLKFYSGFVDDVSYYWHHSNVNMKGEGAVMVSFATGPKPGDKNIGFKYSWMIA